MRFLIPVSITLSCFHCHSDARTVEVLIRLSYDFVYLLYIDKIVHKMLAVTLTCVLGDTWHVSGFGNTLHNRVFLMLFKRDRKRESSSMERRACWLAGKATITSGLRLRRSGMLRTSRLYLRAQSQGLHTMCRLEEKGKEKGSARRSSWLKGRERAMANQTIIGTLSKATLGTPLGDRFSPYVLSWARRCRLLTELNRTDVFERDLSNSTWW